MLNWHGTLSSAPAQMKQEVQTAIIRNFETDFLHAYIRLPEPSTEDTVSGKWLIPVSMYMSVLSNPPGGSIGFQQEEHYSLFCYHIFVTYLQELHFCHIQVVTHLSHIANSLTFVTHLKQSYFSPVITLLSHIQ